MCSSEISIVGIEARRFPRLFHARWDQTDWTSTNGGSLATSQRVENRSVRWTLFARNAEEPKGGVPISYRVSVLFPPANISIAGLPGAAGYLTEFYLLPFNGCAVACLLRSKSNRAPSGRFLHSRYIARTVASLRLLPLDL